MEDMQREPRVAEGSAPEQNDESRTPETSVATARLLANPRRIRRD
ncbi:hypothetical protein [Geodermatophilus sp. URMC 64]